MKAGLFMELNDAAIIQSDIKTLTVTSISCNRNNLWLGSIHWNFLLENDDLIIFTNKICSISVKTSPFINIAGFSNRKILQRTKIRR